MTYSEMKIIEYRTRADAVMVRAKAMEAENDARERRGDTAAYNAESFFAAEQEIEGWAESIMLIAERGRGEGCGPNG